VGIFFGRGKTGIFKKEIQMTTTFVRELAINYKGSKRKFTDTLRDPSAVAPVIRKLLPDNSKEHFIALYLNGAHEVIAVCDREPDIHQLFELANQLGVKLLVRAMHNRCLDNGDKLFDSFAHHKKSFTYVFELPNAKNDLATLTVKYAPVSFALSSHNKNRNYSSKTVKNIMAIYLHENNPPPHRESVSWMLLINCPITSTKKALEAIQWYVQRWKIEVLHKIMKSGCSIELTRLETNKRKLPFITLKSIIAWRLMLITHFNRILPNAPATSILTQNECNALAIIKNNKIVDQKTFSAKKATTWLAELGGYLSRKSDPVPGPLHVWRGWQRLQDYTKMFEILNST